MPDQVTAKDNAKPFPTHEVGQFSAKAADVIDLGQRIEQYPGKPAKIVDKAAIVFVTDSEGEVKDIASEFTVSMYETANLRKFLQGWRGRSYTDDEAKAGVPLDKLVGHGALISVEHKTSSKGRTYAVISTIAPLPRKMEAPASDGYKRAEYWATRKTQYAEECSKWAASQRQVARSINETPEALDEDDGEPLPF